MINWANIQLLVILDQGLDNPFTEGEVWAAIQASPTEKSPGPNGFSGTISEDVRRSSKMTSWGFFRNSIICGEAIL